MIAISYRREDSAPITGRIYDRLQAAFGRDRVFLDFDSIPFGIDFRTHISEALSGCQTLLVVIGPQWLGVSADGSRRIDDPTDFVRLEVAQALARDIRVIPLLIDKTEMPSSTVLPDDLKSLAFRNALRVDSGADFHHHLDRLCAGLEKTSGDPAKRVMTPVAPSVDSRAEKGQQDVMTPVAPSVDSRAEKSQQDVMTPVAPSVDSRAEKGQQDSVATAKEATTPVESTRASQSQSATPVSGITPRSYLILAAVILLVLWLLGSFGRVGPDLILLLLVAVPVSFIIILIIRARRGP